MFMQTAGNRRAVPVRFHFQASRSGHLLGVLGVLQQMQYTFGERLGAFGERGDNRFGFG